MRWAVHIRTMLLIAGILLIAGLVHAPAQTGAGSYVNFSFDQVDIRLLVKLVGEMTGKRFVVDNSVSGKVTIVSPPQIPVDEVYPLFLSVLESAGYSVVEQDGVCNVVALPERGIASAPVVGAEDQGRREGVITKIIQVENISSIELKKVLEPMVRGGKTGALSAFGPTNHLIVTDTSENIKRIEQIIRELDKPGSARVVEFVKLEHASAGRSRRAAHRGDPRHGDGRQVPEPSHPAGGRRRRIRARRCRRRSLARARTASCWSARPFSSPRSSGSR